MKIRLLFDLGCACEVCRTGSQGCIDFPDGISPKGTEFDRPDSYLLVQAGVAEALDDECRAAVNMTNHELKKRQYHYVRTSRGIRPDDFAAYDAGQMIGYYSDGSHIPGPNATRSDGGLILNGDDWSDD